MTTQTVQLSKVYENFTNNAPAPVFETIVKARGDVIASFNPDAIIKVGAKLPEFQLPNAVGKEITSNELLSQGPLLITFYRGEWCPFCNIALHNLQKHLPAFVAKGVTLVAITPELPDRTLTTTEKIELKFPVLSDVGNKFARKLGIVWKQPDTLKPVFKQLGHDLNEFNGDDSFEVPYPATILVDGKGVVRNLYVEPDYTKRVEPEVALGWVDEL